MASNDAARGDRGCKRGRHGACHLAHVTARLRARPAVRRQRRRLAAPGRERAGSAQAGELDVAAFHRGEPAGVGARPDLAAAQAQPAAHQLAADLVAAGAAHRQPEPVRRQLGAGLGACEPQRDLGLGLAG